MSRAINKRLQQVLWLFFAGLMAVSLASCSAFWAQGRYGKLRVATRAASSIFLVPVAPRQKVVYIEVRNQTAVPTAPLKKAIFAALNREGYKVTDDPSKAVFLLQSNLRNLSQMQRGPSSSDVGGESVVGAAGGALAGAAVTRGSAGGALVGGLAGLLGTALVSSSVSVNFYQAVLDVRISQLKDPNLHAPASTKGAWKRHQTRIESVAYQNRLTEKRAVQALAKSLARALAGFF